MKEERVSAYREPRGHRREEPVWQALGFCRAAKERAGTGYVDGRRPGEGRQPPATNVPTSALTYPPTKEAFLELLRSSFTFHLQKVAFSSLYVAQ